MKCFSNADTFHFLNGMECFDFHFKMSFHFEICLILYYFFFNLNVKIRMKCFHFIKTKHVDIPELLFVQI